MIEIHGLKRPTAIGSDATSDNNQGADLNITLIAEQIGRIPAKEQKVSSGEVLALLIWSEYELYESLLTVMHGHAVLLPVVALINSAGVGVRFLIRHRSPGEAAQTGTDQADVAPPAILGGHVDDGVGVGAAHQPAVLPILTVRPGDFVGGGELAVHPDVSFQVS